MLSENDVTTALSILFVSDFNQGLYHFSGETRGTFATQQCLMNMSCPDPFGSYTFMTFAEQVTTLVSLAFPAAVGYTLWRIFVTNRMNPQGGYVLLGLDKSPATYLEVYRQRVSRWTLALYFLTSFGTFSLGLLAFDTYQYVKALLWIMTMVE